MQAMLGLEDEDGGAEVDEHSPEELHEEDVDEPWGEG